jgi:hypothetical protein
MTTYSNPRTHAVIPDWPIGGNARGTAVFKVESNGRGQRATRETEKKNGTWGKPKYGTYGRTVRICDGDDGRTYILSHSSDFNMITVMCGDMKYSHESIHDREERYSEVLAMLTA